MQVSRLVRFGWERQRAPLARAATCSAFSPVGVA
jgi:hypothetical protein